MDFCVAKARSNGVYSLVKHPVKTGIIMSFFAQFFYSFNHGRLAWYHLSMNLVITALHSLAALEDTISSLLSQEQRQYILRVPMVMSLQVRFCLSSVRKLLVKSPSTGKRANYFFGYFRSRRLTFFC
ncbi:MAG: hypothetical protein HQK60_13515 [Deltaproteobacteria bacterium]|nr:hypothetical protein [Deltaproteobacteria bacterium]